MSRQIDGGHLAFLQHALVVHHAVVLAAVAAGGMEEENLLRTGAGLLVEDLASAPDGRGHVGVAADDGVVVAEGLFVRWSGADEGVVEDFERASPDVSPVG